MCGIAGIINLDRSPYPLTLPIMKMTAQMRNRGPDGEGYLLLGTDRARAFSGNDTPPMTDQLAFHPRGHISDMKAEPSVLAFGHRRLSILELSPLGHQPMSDSRGRYWIIFNGEIYNHQAVRELLQSENVDFRGRSDTEVLLQAFIRWGPDCLERLNGMFAFAIFDQQNNRVFLARDRIGIKPLYYTVQDRRFIFASDIKTIIASGLYQPSVNLEGLWHNLSFSIAPRPMTAFKDVFSLEQGHWMTVDLGSGSLSKKSYWRVPLNPESQIKDEDQAQAMLTRQLTESVAMRLEADVEVGTFMSGGVDSTTISAIAAECHPGIQAFTLGFDPELTRFDEVREAGLTAKMIAVKHRVQQIVAADVLDHIQDMVACYEEPYCSLAPNYLISKLVASSGLKVVLNGLGGDELFSGYGFYQTRLWRGLKNIPMLGLIPGGLSQKLDKAKAMGSAKSAGAYYAMAYSNFNETEKQRLFGGELGFDSRTIFERLYPHPDLDRSSINDQLNYFDLLAYIGNHHVYRTDQFTMHFSIEGRFPFLDHQVIEAAFRMHHSLKIRGPIQKYILKKVAEKRIHPSCIAMNKKGFGLPVAAWMNKELKDLTAHCLASLKKRSYFDSKEVDRIHKTFHLTQPNKVWHLVMTELWFQKFFDSPGPVRTETSV